MSAAQFTPGPWWIEDRRKSANHIQSGGALQVQAAHRGEGSSYCVATVHQWEAPDANARLIAAAPELFEALDDVLIHCLADIETKEQEDEPNEAALTLFRARRDKAQSALAKARGEQ